MRTTILVGAALALVAGAATVGAVGVRIRRGPPVPPPAVAGDPVPQPEEEMGPVEPFGARAADEDSDPPLPPLFPRPPERRDARLFVRLADEETGEPADMRVHLWRLEVPEDEHWTERDVEIATLRIQATGGAVEDLDPGRYRLQCEGLRNGAEDPPSFLVRSGENDFKGAVRLPRTLDVHLRVYDEEGRPIERGTCQTVIVSRVKSSPSRAIWARSRMEKLPDGSFQGQGASFCSGRG